MVCSLSKSAVVRPSVAVAPLKVTKSPTAASWLAAVTVIIPEPALPVRKGFVPKVSVLRIGVISLKDPPFSM